MFRGSGSTDELSGEMLTGDALSGDILSGESLTGEESTGLNAYDPSMENDLNAIPDEQLPTDTPSNSGFGFTGGDATPPPTDSGDEKAQLMNLIREHEL